jgi:type II secretory pathway pseudopilin PulG
LIRRINVITSENNIEANTQTSDVKGFALIELLTVVGIIAILIGLLLPAIQQKREEAAALEATARLRQAANAVNYYRERYGEYPQTLAQLVQFVTSNPSLGISIDPRLASGRINGYLYELAEVAAFPDVCMIEAEPEFPGITGSRTVTASLSTRSGGEIISDFETPGSDEARTQMFNRIRVKAAETVLKLFRQGFFFDIPAEFQARSFVDQAMASPDWIFARTVMDVDSDGRITIDEIRNYDDPSMASELKGPLAEFMDYTDDACMWSSLSEAASGNVAVSAGDIELARNQQAPLFSYDGLCALTTTMIAGDGEGASFVLCEKLRSAESAEASGDLRARDTAINEYKRLVQAEIGRSMTRGNANTLIGGRYGDGRFLGLIDVMTAQRSALR